MALSRKRLIFPFLTTTLNSDFNDFFSTKWNELDRAITDQQKKKEAKLSFEKRTFRPDLKDFCFINMQGDNLIKKPGSINGFDFCLDNLKKCCIRLLDKSCLVTASRLLDCKLYIGPVKGMFRLTDSNRNMITVACEKLYMRNCENIILHLYCSTDLKFINCKNIFLAPYNLAYPGLKRQVIEQGMDVATNVWNSTVDSLPLQYFQSVKYTEGIESEEEVINPFPIVFLSRPMSQSGNTIPMEMIEMFGLQCVKAARDRNYCCCLF